MAIITILGVLSHPWIQSEPSQSLKSRLFCINCTYHMVSYRFEIAMGFREYCASLLFVRIIGEWTLLSIWFLCIPDDRLANLPRSTQFPNASQAVPLVNRPYLTGNLLLLGSAWYCGSLYYTSIKKSPNYLKYAPYGGLLVIAGFASFML